MRRTSVRHYVLYEYAKLIADTAIDRRQGLTPADRNCARYWSFASNAFKKLTVGEMNPSEVLRENQLLVTTASYCAYCGTAGTRLQWDHIIPQSRRGPDSIDNMVLACAACNQGKSARNPIEWYEDRNLGRGHIPRIVMGKLLKLILEEHRRRGTLDEEEFPKGEALSMRGISKVFEVVDPAPLELL